MPLYPMLVSHWLGQCQERGLTWDKVALQLNSRLPRELTAEVYLLASVVIKTKGMRGDPSGTSQHLGKHEFPRVGISSSLSWLYPRLSHIASDWIKPLFLLPISFHKEAKVV